MKNIGVIGGGIVGLATAYKLSQRLPRARITVFEKEDAFGKHQSTHNSGVLHAGLYYKPGSAKARLAVSGLRQMLEFCRDAGVAHEQCGKLVIATDEREAGLLRNLLDRGNANGLRGLCLIGPQEIQEREPHVQGIAAIHVPEEGIVDYHQVIDRLAEKIRSAGHALMPNWRISRIERRNFSWLLHSDVGEDTCDFIVNTAGLYCDRVSQMTGERRQARIVPFRGEFYKLRKERQHLVRHLVYPVPDPKFPFLGVHFTRLIYGGIEAGPNAVLAFSREGYRKADFSLRDLADSLGYVGFWRFAARHGRLCWYELRRSFSKRLFTKALQKLVPEVQVEDLEMGGAGVRAQAMSPDGSLVDDFHFIHRPGALHVLNAPSPAATACLAIADEVVDQIVTYNPELVSTEARAA